VQVLNTHLSVYPKERRQQVSALMSGWSEPAIRRGCAILCGDFNAQPKTQSYRAMAKRMRDVQTFDPYTPSNTWFSSRPLARIDHIFITADFGVERVNVVRSRLARIASDHLPLVADLQVPLTNVHAETHRTSGTHFTAR
jgi:endonuclease/exonuclease/phosphatase family metal-dependent hydrolase